MIKVSGNNQGDIMNHELSQVIKQWNHISPLIGYPKNDKQFNSLVERLDKLLDIIGKNEKHELMGLVDVISHFIQEYEAEHYAINHDEPTGVDALKFLMEAHHLSQSDLPEIGSQGVVSEILSGKRELNLKHIKALAKRFNVAASTFI
jgi:HTH-type transcriptional regulator / antitoxin HigA